MVSMNGIPRGTSPADFAQRVRDLERTVERLTSAATYVSIGNIVEGGTIGQAAGAQLTETVQGQIVVGRENVADDALNDRVLTGSTVQTSDAPDEGVKLQGSEVSAYGRGISRVPGQPDVPFKNRAVITQRTTPFSWSEDDLWAGLWFESDREDGKGGPPPKWAAGVTASGATADGVVGTGARWTELTGYAEFGANSNDARLAARGAQEVPNGDRDESIMWVAPRIWRITSHLKGVTQGDTASIRHDGDGVVRIDAVNGVLINGETLGGKGSDSGWKTATYQNGWMDYGNGFGGLQYRKKDGVLYLRGSIKGGANVTTVSNLPADFRPVVPEGTTAMEFPIAVSQGGTWSSGVMYAYANGNLTYSANAATWTGFNRAVINAAFPL